MELLDADFDHTEHSALEELNCGDQRSLAPEHCLWFAVIKQFIDDYRDALTRIARESRKGPVNLLERKRLEEQRNEVWSANFATALELLDVSPDVLLKQLERLERDFGLHSIEFTAEIDLSQWQNKCKGFRDARRYLPN